MRVDDLDEALPHRLVLLQVDNQRFGHGDPVARPKAVLLAPAALDNPHVRSDIPAPSLHRLDEDSFVHPRAQIAGQQ